MDVDDVIDTLTDDQRDSIKPHFNLRAKTNRL